MEAINLKYQLLRGMINLNCIMDCILCQIFRIIEYIIKIMRHWLITHQYKYISSNLKTELYLELRALYYISWLLCWTFNMWKKKLIASTENTENVAHLEIADVVLVHCNIVNNNFLNNLRVSYTSVSNKWFDQLLSFISI